MNPAKLFLFLLTALTLTAPPNRCQAEESEKEANAAEGPGAQVKVMSFNIRYGTARDGENAWPHRKEAVVAAIEDYDPDLLGTQEALEFQVEFLAENLPQFAVYSVPREPGGGEACAIYYRKEMFELRSKGTFWLSESPDKPASKSWDSSLPRIASWVILKHKATGTEFLFANTHFDHRGSKARAESAKLLRKHLPELADGRGIILTGDFNCPEGSAPHTTLTGAPDEAALVDTYRARHPKSESRKEGTFSGFRPEAGESRIDWVLCSPEFGVTQADIVRTSYKGRIPSDHFPVTATVKITKK